MTTLIFVRHGQSVSNLEQRFTGQHETPLTDLGHEQAEATARYLDSFHIDAIYSSDLSRSMQTAQHTAARRGMEILPEVRFREIDAGLWEGRKYTELRDAYPENYEKWRTDLGHAHPEGGESVIELSERVWEGVRAVLAKHPDQTVAVFTHATPVRVMACRWYGIPVERAAEVPFCTNASVSVAQYENTDFHSLVQYSYDQHQGAHITALPRDLV